MQIHAVAPGKSAVFGGQHFIHLAKFRRELAGALVAHSARNFGHAIVAVAQQRGRAFHAMLAHMRRDGIAVNRLKQRLQRGGIDVEAARKLVYGDAAGQVGRQRYTHIPSPVHYQS